MTIQVKGISTRNDTSGDWYWTTTDPVVVEHLAELNIVYDDLGITYTDSETNDGLVWVKTLNIPDETTWNTLFSLLFNTEKGKEYIEVRDDWFKTHNHTLVLERYNENGQLVQVIDVLFE